MQFPFHTCFLGKTDPERGGRGLVAPKSSFLSSHLSCVGVWTPCHGPSITRFPERDLASPPGAVTRVAVVAARQGAQAGLLWHLVRGGVFGACSGLHGLRANHPAGNAFGNDGLSVTSHSSPPSSSLFTSFTLSLVESNYYDLLRDSEARAQSSATLGPCLRPP